MSPRSGLCAALLASLLAPPAAAAITGVCPDGSIFIVQSAAAIPCPQAKRVDPSDVPPIQPEYLPRPYGWERFERRSDPNNPYNVVGETPPVALARPPAPQAAPSAAPPPRSAAAPVGAPPVARGLDLALSAREVADLHEIVTLLQSVAPATVARYAADGSRRAALQLARSDAFEARVHRALVSQGRGQRGPVVLFRAEAVAPESFHGNLTFVQGHIAFHPDPANPEQLGLLDGAVGELAPGDAVLGYAVLPEHLDLARPLDVYWDDRQTTATLRP